MSSKLIAPSNTTKMVSPEGKQWIRAIRPIHVNGLTIPEGKCAEVDAKDAQEFCDRKFKGPYDFEGEMSSRNASRTMILRAERVDESTGKANQLGA